MVNTKSKAYLLTHLHGNFFSHLYYSVDEIFVTFLMLNVLFIKLVFITELFSLLNNLSSVLAVLIFLVITLNDKS